MINGKDDDKEDDDAGDGYYSLSHGTTAFTFDLILVLPFSPVAMQSKMSDGFKLPLCKCQQLNGNCKCSQHPSIHPASASTNWITSFNYRKKKFQPSAFHPHPPPPSSGSSDLKCFILLLEQRS